MAEQNVNKTVAHRL